MTAFPLGNVFYGPVGLGLAPPSQTSKFNLEISNSNPINGSNGVVTGNVRSKVSKPVESIGFWGFIVRQVSRT